MRLKKQKPSLTSSDELFLQHCCDIAWAAQTLALPNPSVGAVVVDSQGEIIGRGVHKIAGAPHAEVLAIKEAYLRLSGDEQILVLRESLELHEYIIRHHQGLFRDCTLYVSLEPCNHYGKTPPCASLVGALSFKRVVIGASEESKHAAGGADNLRLQGMEVVCANLPSAKNLLLPFLSLQNKGRFVLFKLAMRLDGSYTSGRISGARSRTFTHNQRSVCDMVCVGGATWRSDAPRLSAREVEVPYAKKAPKIGVISQREGNSSLGKDSHNAKALLHCGARQVAPHSQGFSVAQSLAANTRIVGSEFQDSKTFSESTLSDSRSISESTSHATLESKADSETAPAERHALSAMESSFSSKRCLEQALKASSGRGDCQGGRERLRNLSPSPLDEKKKETNEVRESLEVKAKDSEKLESATDSESRNLAGRDTSLAAQYDNNLDSKKANCHARLAPARNDKRTESHSLQNLQSPADSTPPRTKPNKGQSLEFIKAKIALGIEDTPSALKSNLSKSSAASVVDSDPLPPPPIFIHSPAHFDEMARGFVIVEGGFTLLEALRPHIDMILIHQAFFTTAGGHLPHTLSARFELLHSMRLGEDLALWLR